MPWWIICLSIISLSLDVNVFGTFKWSQWKGDFTMGNVVTVDGHKWEEIEDGIYKVVEPFTTTKKELFHSDNYSRFSVVGNIIEGIGMKDGVLSPIYMCVKHSSVDRFDELVNPFLKNSRTFAFWFCTGGPHLGGLFV